MFNGKYGADLINLREYRVVEVGAEDPESGLVDVRVAVVGPTGGASEFKFKLARKAFGVKKGAWVVKALLRKPD
jgi:hypothetical protein